MLIAAVMSVSLGLLADAAVPSTTAPPPPAATKKLKCEKIVQLGSRMPVRVCRTPEQIKQTEIEARDTTTRLQKINPEQYN